MELMSCVVELVRCKLVPKLFSFPLGKLDALVTFKTDIVFPLGSSK